MLDLLRRLQSRISDSFDSFDTERPYVASLRELDGGDGEENGEQWAVLHRVTRRGLQLIHWQPIASTRLAVRIELSLNEALEVIVSAESCERCGPFYGTLATFYPNSTSAI